MKRHFWFTVLLTFAFTAIAAGVASQADASFQSVARVSLDVSDPVDQYLLGGRATSQTYLASQQEIVRSAKVYQRTADKLGLASGAPIDGSIEPLSSMQPNLLLIAGTAKEAGRAQEIANAAAAAFVEVQREEAIEGLLRVSRQLDSRLADLENQLRELDASESAEGVQADSARATRSALSVQYQTLFSKQQDLLIRIDLEDGGAVLRAPAETPYEIGIGLRRTTALGALVGLALAVGIAFVREQLDDRFHTRIAVEEELKLPVLGDTPTDRATSRDPDAVPVVLKPVGGVAEAVRALRVSIDFLAVDSPIKRLVVTSPAPGDGKSFVSANLAAVYAIAGKKTLLVSSDLRRPRLDKVFDISDKRRGLTDLIADWRSSGFGDQLLLDDAIQPTEVDNLFMIRSGKTAPNPAELLGSDRMAAILRELSTQFEMIILDTPPVLAVADASIVASHADGTLLVVALTKSHRRAARRAVEILEKSRARVLGVALNRSSEEQGSGAYTYSYRYQYQSKAGAKELPDLGKQNGETRRSEPDPKAPPGVATH